MRWDIVSVREEFAKRGYKLLSEEYVNNKEPLHYQCPSHPDEILTINLNNLLTGYGCSLCAAERQIGDGNYNWKGGVSGLNHYLRANIWEWKDSVREQQSRCWIAGETTDLDVHHIRPYHKIRDEALETLGLTPKDKIGDYEPSEQMSLLKLVRKLHTLYGGVLLHRDIHRLFHKTYGFDVDFEDLLEFKERYLRGDISGIGGCIQFC